MTPDWEGCVRYYHSKDGDTADRIAWAIYGRQNDRLTEALMDANPGLAAYGPILPAGLRIMVPDAPAPGATATVRLWS